MSDKSSVSNADNSKNIKTIFIIVLVAAIVAGIRFSGVTEFFNQESLRQTVASWGVLAPAGFVLLYTIAPALFIPGLPLTIAAGVLFGPVWGLIYAITGATAGASVAFLISRYVARNWIKSKLNSPKIEQLDINVEKNGWKIVAITRLVPLLPFNLLNYAFGLTSIPFIQYAVTSFICMLPATAAFILFSDSLLDLFKGKISQGLIAGVLIIGVVALIPVILKKYSKKPGGV